MKNEFELTTQVVEYLNQCGYSSERIVYNYKTNHGRLIDLLVKSNRENLISVEVKGHSELFNIRHSELSYHPTVRQLQRESLEIEAKYYIISNGFKHIWFKTGSNGRPEVIPAIMSNETIAKNNQHKSLTKKFLNHISNFIKNHPITENFTLDFSIVLYLKILNDLNLPFDESENELDSYLNNNELSFLNEILDKFNDINITRDRDELLNFIDEFLLKNIPEWDTPRWLANFMVALYPDNETKTNCLDLFSRSGTLISSAYKGGWENVDGCYFDQTKTYWIKINELLFTEISKTRSYNLNSFFTDFNHKSIKQYDCILLSPPFNSKINPGNNEKSNYSVELLIDMALKNITESGYIFTIVPDSMLLSSSHKEFRKNLIQHSKVLGIIKLPIEIFKPHSSASTSLIILKRKINNNGFFVASLENKGIGNDSYLPIVKNWQSFTNGMSLNDHKEGFVVNELNYDNLHFSNYWYNNKNNLEKLQNGFQSVPLKNIAREVLRGKSYKRSDDEDISYLAPAAVRKMEIIDDSLSYTSKELEPKHPTIVFENDIVINIIGTQKGSAALIDSNYEGFGINHHLIVIRPNTKYVNPYFLAIALNSDYVQNQLKNGSQGTVIPSLNLNSFDSLYIPIPPLYMQEEICNEYKSALNKLKEKEKELNKQKLKIKSISSQIGRDNQA